MTHTPGILFNADTGYMLDAGIIVVVPQENAVVVLHGPHDDQLHVYGAEEFPRVTVLPFVFNPN